MCDNDVHRILIESFISVLGRLIGSSIEYSAKKIDFLTSKNVLIRTRGNFSACLFFCMDSDFEHTIIECMKGTENGCSNEDDLFVGEFVNILSGHALTKLNNLMGSSSRLSVPEVGALSKGVCEEFQKQYTLCFKSTIGNMRVDVGYEYRL
ncbi:MAG: chemotaxis protein CheX [Lachnospiraceae bacterium]|nr:chemotaxis protein CheX [Lachnospiraceae bacterium]